MMTMWSTNVDQSTHRDDSLTSTLGKQTLREDIQELCPLHVDVSLFIAGSLAGLADAWYQPARLKNVRRQFSMSSELQ